MEVRVAVWRTTAVWRNPSWKCQWCLTAPTEHRLWLLPVLTYGGATPPPPQKNLVKESRMRSETPTPRRGVLWPVALFWRTEGARLDRKRQGVGDETAKQIASASRVSGGIAVQLGNPGVSGTLSSTPEQRGRAGCCAHSRFTIFLCARPASSF